MWPAGNSRNFIEAMFILRCIWSCVQCAPAEFIALVSTLQEAMARSESSRKRPGKWETERLGLGNVVSGLQGKESSLSVEGGMMKRREEGSSVAGYADGEQDCLSYKE